MQKLYETLFQQYDVACSQILVTEDDFGVEEVTLRALVDASISDTATNNRTDQTPSVLLS